MAISFIVMILSVDEIWKKTTAHIVYVDIPEPIHSVVSSGACLGCSRNHTIYTL